MAGRKTIRFRITIGFIATILLMNTVLALVIVLLVSNVVVEEVQTRVRLDLNSAREVYQGHVEDIARFLHAVSARWSVPAPIEEAVAGDYGRLLRTFLDEGGMDILILVGPDGRVIYRAHNPGIRGDSLLESNPVVAHAVQQWRPVSGTIISSREELLADGEQLADLAYFEVRPTPAARPSTQQEQTAGMLIAAAVPLVDLNRPQERVGVLYGATLLNRRYEIVDTIKDQVFQQQTYHGKDIGTATIFQGDLRISTNVLDTDGSRGIGTRLSEEVYDRVLEQGQLWADRAFVLNDWYITAYEPIRDPDGKIIGALYVGLLEEPFTQQRSIILSIFLPIVAFTTIVSFFLLALSTRHVLWPIGRIIEMTQKVLAGDMKARVGIRPPGEMGLLCQSIDEVAQAVYERGRKYAIETRKQIIQSEKLASIGRLAAGIAHEINNPLTGVLTFAHLLRQDDTMGDQQKEDLDLIIRETTRVREIVRGLLDFARESRLQKQALKINDVLKKSLALVRSQKEQMGITIREELADGLPQVFGDKNQLEQVFLNLSMNACEAMPEGGMLTIKTASEDDRIVVTVQDTGIGISEDNLPKIMDPFFTTKPVGKGTGLGLSVTYGIVQRHSGSIDVKSKQGEGTTFTVHLPSGIPSEVAQQPE